MCNFSGMLIAWLDHELPEDEATNVGRHVRICADCRGRIESYREVSDAFNVYCDAAIESNARRRMPQWIPVISGAVAAAVALFMVFARARVEQPQVQPQTVAASATVAVEKTPVPIKKVHRRAAVAHVQSQDAKWVPPEPAIEIAIPAEAMFPPGAVPEGVSFVADVSIAADGSAQLLRLRPQLIEFEGGSTQ